MKQRARGRTALFLGVTLVAAGAVLVAAGDLRAQDAADRRPPKTLEEGASCTAEQCHKGLASGPSVHKPVLRQGCDVCHEPQDDRHEFKLADKPPALCFLCHEDLAEKKTVHEPLKEEDGSCLMCHDPHVGKAAGLLKRETANSLCLQCHRDVTRGGAYHTTDTVDDGCVACHDAHSSDTARLVRREPPGLCATCHTDIRKQLATSQLVHGPVNVGCVACHDPHKVRDGKGLAASGAAQCTSCHVDFKEQAAAMALRHGAPLEDAGCLRCHAAHAASHKQLLLDSSQALCLACHKKNVERADRSTVPGLGPQIEDAKVLHGPLSRGDCAGCHEPHANSVHYFLRGAYPATFYQAYEEEAYGACFTCHEADLVEQEKTEAATGFRNGEQNLHYVHVDRRKGRTCRVCHLSHAGRVDHLLRESVPFGSWELPIGFTATENGGSCAVGCHQTQRYDRENPVSYGGPPPALPAPQEGSPATRAP